MGVWGGRSKKEARKNDGGGARLHSGTGGEASFHLLGKMFRGVGEEPLLNSNKTGFLLVQNNLESGGGAE